MTRTWMLWLVVLTGPAIWLLSFGASYSIAGWLCQVHWKPALFAISLVALAIAGGSVMLGWSQWQKLGREPAGEGAGVVPRSRILAIGGILLGALSVLLIVAQAIGPLMLGDCE